MLRGSRRAFGSTGDSGLEDGGARLPDRLLQGDMHVAILPAGDERLQGRPLFPMHLLAVLPKTHAFGHRPALEVTNLADKPVMVGSGFASRVWFDAACESAHFKPNVVLESAAPHTLIALVKSGYGIAVLPSSVSMLHEGVCVLPLVQARRALGRWAIAAWDGHRFLPPYAECFVQDLAAHCKRAYPGRHLAKGLPPLARPARDTGLADT